MQGMLRRPHLNHGCATWLCGTGAAKSLGTVLLHIHIRTLWSVRHGKLGLAANSVTATPQGYQVASSCMGIAAQTGLKACHHTVSVGFALEL